MSRIRLNPLFPGKLPELSVALGQYWRELSTTVNKLDSGIVAVSAPATAASDGTPGQVAYDSSYIYVCVATNTWKRAAISTW